MHRLPLGLHPWLMHHGSITEKLKQYTTTTLQCLFQQWITPSRYDQKQYHLPDENMFHREILMLTPQHICWYARTLIPHATYHNPYIDFTTLTHRPLGELIWHNPHIERYNRHFFSLDQTHPDYIRLQKHLTLSAQHLWGRRTIFLIRHIQPLYLYLIEIFLPDLVHYYE